MMARGPRGMGPEREDGLVQFLVMSRRRVEEFETADFDKVLPAESERVRELYAAGTVRQVWLRGDLAGACLLVEGEDQASVEAMVATLPMAASGLSEFTVIPLGPYRGFGPR